MAAGFDGKRRIAALLIERNRFVDDVFIPALKAMMFAAVRLDELRKTGGGDGIGDDGGARGFAQQDGGNAVSYTHLDVYKRQIRIRAKGGAGTHNGMRSILAHLGEGGFPRVRLGVGAPPAKWDLVDYVLGVPKGEDEKAFLTSVEHGAAATELLLTRGVEAAQQAYNGA